MPIKRILVTLVVLSAMIAVAVPDAARAADAPQPIVRALEAVDLTIDQLTFDSLDMGLYGGDCWRLRYFDALIDRPLRIPGDVEVLQRNLLRSADSPANLFMAATSRLETGVRRGLITDPAEEIEESLPKANPLPAALQGLCRRAGKPLIPEEAARLRSLSAGLPDSIARSLAVLVQAIALAADARDEAFAPLSPPRHQRGWGFTESGYDLEALADSAVRYVVSADAGDFTASFARGVEEPAGLIDYRLWNAGIGDLLLTLEQTLPILRRNAQTIGSKGWRVETPFGAVSLSGPGSDYHSETNPLLVIDVGGNDEYSSGAAGTLSRPVSMIIDLSGNDTYRTADTLAPCFGAGLLGLGVLIDEAGDDTYEGGHISLGAGLYGVGILIDRAGDDRYEAITASQGAGLFGVGILSDESGNDIYHAFQQIQGYGYVRGAGMLIDVEGDDRYVADNESIRFPSSQDKQSNSSLAQGFGFGKRADYLDGHSLAGGLGFLIDGAGNDDYRCGVFGQGCAYWYGVGILADATGNDSYDGIWYVQGSGAHFALGILWEGDGDDIYHATRNMAIGAGHDFSLGLLYERSGDDRYTAPNLSLGGGNANGIGFFWDVEGDDDYSVEAGTTLGRANVGRRGGRRDRMETLGLFLDTGGADTYPVSKAFAGNNRLWTQTGLNKEHPLDTERGVGIDTTWTPADQPGWRTRRDDR